MRFDCIATIGARGSTFLRTLCQRGNSFGSLERKNSVQDSGGIGERRSLLGILTQEGAQIFDNLVRRLHEIVIDAKLDEGSNCDR